MKQYGRTVNTNIITHNDNKHNDNKHTHYLKLK